MNIKEQLKSIDVKITKLATGLSVSRPTLDAYIDIYEKGGKIPNEKYQEIFSYLFSDENITPIEFAQKYDYVKRMMLSDVNNKLFENSSDKRKSYLSRTLVSLVNNESVTLETLEFVYLLMRSTDNKAIKLLSEYICLSNGITDWEGKELTDEQKAFFSSLSEFFDSYKEGTLKIDNDRINMLLERNAKMNGHRKNNSNEEELIEYLKTKGLDTNNIDFEYIKNILNERKED